jgi:hypothetical protein
MFAFSEEQTSFIATQHASVSTFMAASFWGNHSGTDQKTMCNSDNESRKLFFHLLCDIVSLNIWLLSEIFFKNADVLQMLSE